MKFGSVIILCVMVKGALWVSPRRVEKGKTRKKKDAKKVISKLGVFPSSLAVTVRNGCRPDHPLLAFDLPFLGEGCSQSRSLLANLSKCHFLARKIYKAIDNFTTICPETIPERIHLQFPRCKDYVTAPEINSPKSPTRQKAQYEITQIPCENKGALEQFQEIFCDVIFTLRHPK